MNEEIKVSAITITRNRVEYLKRCIEYFCNQTHPNKEHMILYYNDDEDTKKYLRGLDEKFLEDNNIRISNYKPIEHVHLGALRNYLISKSTGEYIIIWDDDDMHDEKRMEEQLAQIINSPFSACTLSTLILFSEKHQEIRESSKRNEGWEGTLMCKKDHMPAYSNLKRYEDTPVLQKLVASDKLFTYYAPYLYVYRLHSGNISVENHKESLFSTGSYVNGYDCLVYKQKLGYIT